MLGFWIALSLTLPVLKCILGLFFPVTNKRRLFSSSLPHSKELGILCKCLGTWAKMLIVSYQPVIHWSSLAQWNPLNVTLGPLVPGSSDEVQARDTKIMFHSSMGGRQLLREEMTSYFVYVLKVLEDIYKVYLSKKQNS